MESIDYKIKNILIQLSDLDADESIALLNMIAEIKGESSDSDYEPSEDEQSSEEEDADYEEVIDVSESPDGFFEIIDNILKSKKYKDYKKRCVKP